MKWQRKGDMGMISSPYFVGKFVVNGHLEYRVWHNADLIGQAPTWEKIQELVEKHAQGAPA